MENLHDRPAEEANTDHKEPAGNNAETKEDVTERNVQAVLSEPAIKRVEGALVGFLALPCLIGMDLVDDFRSNGRGVQVVEVDWSRGTGLAWNGNWNLEVPE